MAAKRWFDSYGNLLRRIPKACVEDCAHPGPCDADVQHWRRRLNFTVPRAAAERYLKEFGAWDDLATITDAELAGRVLWVACGAIKEQGGWFGLV